MHNICLVFKNKLEVKVQVIDESLEDFYAALEEGKPYISKERGVGFWLPPENLMYAYSHKITPEEPCLENTSTE